MIKKISILDQVERLSKEEKYHTIYRYLRKAENKKLKVCEMEYTGLPLMDFVIYYEKHQDEVDNQIIKYEKEIAKIQKEKKKQYNQVYLKKYGKEIIEYRKKYYQDHIEELKEYNRERARSSKSERREYAKKWNGNNPYKRKAYNEKWRAKHPDYSKNYYKKLKAGVK